MEEMGKETLQYVNELAITAAKNRVIKEDGNGQTLLIGGDGTPHLFIPQNKVKEELRVHTLGALCDYILNTNERKWARLIIQVTDPDNVELFGEVDEYGRREHLVSVRAIHPNFAYEKWIDPETFVIQLSSMFVPGDNVNLLLKVVGNLEEKNARTAEDDGVSQVVAAKTGVATKADVIVPSPIELAPMRTFAEVEQPESKFIFRLHEGPTAGLFPGDGGQWRNDAIRNIAEFLCDRLDGVLDRVTVLA
jgi:hypothetical protein